MITSEDCVGCVQSCGFTKETTRNVLTFYILLRNKNINVNTGSRCSEKMRTLKYLVYVVFPIIEF